MGSSPVTVTWRRGNSKLILYSNVGRGWWGKDFIFKKTPPITIKCKISNKKKADKKMKKKSDNPQSAFTCSKLTTVTLQKSVKYVQS